MQEIEPVRERRRLPALKLLVILLAVIGLFSIAGTLLSAAFWLLKAVIMGAVGFAVLYLLFRVFIGRSKPDRA